MVLDGCIPSEVDESVYVYENEVCAAAVYPKQYMLKTQEKMSQGYTSWCVAFSAMNMQYSDVLRRIGKGVRVSPGFLMAKAKELDNNPNAKGTYLKTMCQVLNKYGSCEYELYPFKNTRDEVLNDFKPITENMITSAAKYKVKNYARIASLEGIKQAIKNDGGCLLNLAVFDNYTRDDRGFIDTPDNNDRVLGYHCVFACGWDDNLECVCPSGRKHKGFIIVQDSDRIDLTSNGFRYLPYDAFTVYTRNVDRVFKEAYVTYEKDVNYPTIHDEMKLSTPKVKQREVTMKLGSKEIVINSSEVIKMDVVPQVIDGTTLIPLKYVGQALDIDVQWNQQYKYARAYDQSTGKCRIFKINDNHAWDASGTQILMTGIVNVQIINGRTMIPIRLFAESFGCDVEYKNRTITIRK